MFSFNPEMTNVNFKQPLRRRRRRRWKRRWGLDVRRMFGTHLPCWPYVQCMTITQKSKIMHNWVAQIEFTDAVSKSLHRLQPRQRRFCMTAWVTLLCKCFPPSPFYLFSILNTSNYTELPAKHLTNPLLSSQDRFWLIRIKRQKRPLYNTGENHMLKRLFIHDNWIQQKKKHAQTCQSWRSCGISKLA